MSAVLESTFVVPEDHPAFDGHFPGHPILPGVALLAEALAALERATGRPASAWTIDQVKFTSPVEPGARLAIVHRHDGRADRFEIRAGDRLVASGTLSARDER